MKIRHPPKVEERTSWILVEKKKKKDGRKNAFSYANITT